jgi:hypothetical protein
MCIDIYEKKSQNTQGVKDKDKSKTTSTIKNWLIPFTIALTIFIGVIILISMGIYLIIIRKQSKTKKFDNGDTTTTVSPFFQKMVNSHPIKKNSESSTTLIDKIKFENPFTKKDQYKSPLL